MNKILCGTDFSENATQAALAAAAIAKHTGAALILAHAADELGTHAEPVRERERFLDPERRKLDDAVDRLAAAGANVQGQLLTGQWAEDAILEVIVKDGVDLVVVSAAGKRAFDRWTLGSVSERIAEAAPRPTLVVRSAAPFEAWARGERALKVFVAFDFTSVSDAALRWAKKFTAAGRCEIVVGYVDWPTSETARLGIPEAFYPIENSPRIQEILERDVTRRAAAVLGEGVARVRVEPTMGRPDYPLIQMALHEQADLVVVGTHQRQGLGRLGHPSMSRGLLRGAPMSVVCVPAAAAPVGPASASLLRVLVATDLSERGSLAVPYAFGAVRSGGTVRMIHVMEPYRLPNPLIGGHPEPHLPSQSAHAEMIADAEKRLRALVPSDVAERGIVADMAVIESRDNAKAIRQEAERFGADLVCIGSHGHGLASAMLGSVANSLVAHCPRPVLVVREPAR